MSKTAFVTGVTGQDGSYLAELLLGQEVLLLVEEPHRQVVEPWHGDASDQAGVSVKFSSRIAAS